MGKLNKIPEGLLSLLASKTDGTNPNDLAETVRGAIDLLAFYSTTMSVNTLSTVFAGLDSEINVQVPSNEVWLVHAAHVTCRYAFLAEVVILGLKFTGVVNQNGVPQDVFFESPVNRMGGVTPGPSTFNQLSAERTSHFFEKPFVLRAGQGIAGHLIEFDPVGAGALNGTVAVLHTKMLF